MQGCRASSVRRRGLSQALCAQLLEQLYNVFLRNPFIRDEFFYSIPKLSCVNTGHRRYRIDSKCLTSKWQLVLAETILEEGGWGARSNRRRCRVLRAAESQLEAGREADRLVEEGMQRKTRDAQYCAAILAQAVQRYAMQSLHPVIFEAARIVERVLPIEDDTLIIRKNEGTIVLETRYFRLGSRLVAHVTLPTELRYKGSRLVCRRQLLYYEAHSIDAEELTRRLEQGGMATAPLQDLFTTERLLRDLLDALRAEMTGYTVKPYSSQSLGHEVGFISWTPRITSKRPPAKTMIDAVFGALDWPAVALTTPNREWTVAGMMGHQTTLVPPTPECSQSSGHILSMFKAAKATELIDIHRYISGLQQVFQTWRERSIEVLAGKKLCRTQLLGVKVLCEGENSRKLTYTVDVTYEHPKELDAAEPVRCWLESEIEREVNLWLEAPGEIIWQTCRLLQLKAPDEMEPCDRMAILLRTLQDSLERHSQAPADWHTTEMPGYAGSGSSYSRVIVKDDRGDSIRSIVRAYGSSAFHVCSMDVESSGAIVFTIQEDQPGSFLAHLAANTGPYTYEEAPTIARIILCLLLEAQSQEQSFNTRAATQHAYAGDARLPLPSSLGI